MATASPSRSDRVTAETGPTLSALAKYFGPAQQDKLLAEDYIAGRNVASILIAVVAAATIAGLGAVLWIVFVAG